MDLQFSMLAFTFVMSLKGEKKHKMRINACFYILLALLKWEEVWKLACVTAHVLKHFKYLAFDTWKVSSLIGKVAFQY